MMDKKQLLHALVDTEYTIDIYKVGHFTFPSSYTFQSHNHREIEISYITGGSCIMEIDGDYVTLRQGECVIIYPNTTHNFLVKVDQTCSLAQLEFVLDIPSATQESLYFFRELKDKNRRYAKLQAADQVAFYVERLAEETRKFQTSALRQVALELHFLQLYILLSDQIEALRAQELQQSDNKFEQVLDHIHNNITGDLNMGDICQTHGVSSRYIRRKFSENLGMGSSQYITLLRISKSKEYLQNNSNSITDVALLCGFSNSQYFSRVFKEEVGESPTEYRIRLTKDTNPLI